VSCPRFLFKIVNWCAMAGYDKFVKSASDQKIVREFDAAWAQNFLLQTQTTTPHTMELALKETASVIDTRLVSVATMSDRNLMELISYMRELAALLYVYNNETCLLQTRCPGITIMELRWNVIATSELFERHIVSTYNIQ